MKQKNSRKLTCISLTLVLMVMCILMSTITVNANWLKEKEIPIPTVKEDVYVYDQDNIIDNAIEEKINAILIQLEENTGAEVAVITVTSLLDMEIEDYSYELANTLGIGKAEEDNGILLLISKSDEKVRLEIGKGLEGCLPDSRCGRILDEYFVPYRESGQYTEAVYNTVEAIVSCLAKEYNISVSGIGASIATQMEEKEKEEAKTTVKILIIIFIIIVALAIADGIFFDGAIFLSIFDGDSSGGGSSSGGSSFGGGGFGGGGFGGGGATR